MQIGSIVLDNITILAPLAGFTHPPFRILAKEAGCALVWSEMISANGLVYKSEKTKQLLASSQQEKPIAVQIFGADPAIMAEATLTLALPKQGLQHDAAKKQVGELYLADISIPPGLYSHPPLDF